MGLVNENFNYFSVVIPLYNKEKFVTRAIESILTQSYQNFEIIVINDGSTDDSERIVRLLNDYRILIINQINSGVSSARNKGVELAKYNYVAFLDADDTWMPTFLEKINFLINEFPTAGIYAANNYFKFPNRTVFSENLNTLFDGSECGVIQNYFELFSKIKKSPFSNSNFCIPVSVFKSIGGYKNGVRLTEDSDLWCRVALKYDIAYSIKPLSTYFVTLVGTTHEIFSSDDFQVTLTLESALRNNEVKNKYVKSVKKLISLQKLNLIKRAILTNNILFALRKLFKFNYLLYYPLDTIKYFVLCFIPHKFIKIWKEKTYN